MASLSARSHSTISALDNSAIFHIFADVPSERAENPRNSLYIDLSSAGEQSKRLWQDAEVQMTASVGEGLVLG